MVTIFHNVSFVRHSPWLLDTVSFPCPPMVFPLSPLSSYKDTNHIGVSHILTILFFLLLSLKDPVSKYNYILSYWELEFQDMHLWGSLFRPYDNPIFTYPQTIPRETDGEISSSSRNKTLGISMEYDQYGRFGQNKILAFGD